MRGGAFNTAAFFGVDESRHYKTENIGVDIMNIDFSKTSSGYNVKSSLDKLDLTEFLKNSSEKYRENTF